MSSYEVHVGEVSSREDPEKRGRLKVKFTTIFEGEYPEWVDPCFPFAGSNCGFFALPPVGTAVECEVHRGKGPDVSIDTPRIRWRGALYNRVDQIPTEFKKNYPYRMGLKSPGGHILILDDTEGKEYLLLGHGKKKRTFLCFDQHGSVSLHCATKNGFEFGLDIDARKGSVRILAVSSLEIYSAGAIGMYGKSVSINGRPVAWDGGPI